jgi:hypothetical protein
MESFVGGKVGVSFLCLQLAVVDLSSWESSPFIRTNSPWLVRIPVSSRLIAIFGESALSMGRRRVIDTNDNAMFMGALSPCACEILGIKFDSARMENSRLAETHQGVDPKFVHLDCCLVRSQRFSENASPVCPRLDCISSAWRALPELETTLRGSAGGAEWITKTTTRSSSQF